MSGYTWNVIYLRLHISVAKNDYQITLPRSKIFEARNENDAIYTTAGAVCTLQLGKAIPFRTYEQIAGNSRAIQTAGT